MSLGIKTSDKRFKQGEKIMEFYFSEETGNVEQLPEYKIEIYFKTQEEMDEFEDFLYTEWATRPRQGLKEIKKEEE